MERPEYLGWFLHVRRAIEAGDARQKPFQLCFLAQGMEQPSHYITIERQIMGLDKFLSGLYFTTPRQQGRTDEGVGVIA
jgi:hypothetical protein